jgi:hypothetical protein
MANNEVTTVNFREKIRDILMDRLYSSQLAYWEHQVDVFAKKNATRHGHALIDDESVCYGVNYLGKNWGSQDDHTVTLFSLPLAEEGGEDEEEFLEMTIELGELEAESYIAGRFLANLVMHDASPEAFEEALGRSLFGECSEVLDIQKQLVDRIWNENALISFKTYVEEHEYIIKAMNERLMMNLLTQQQTVPL